jgi:hypothetical protein
MGSIIMSMRHHFAPCPGKPMAKRLFGFIQGYDPQSLGLPNLVWHIYSPSFINQVQVRTRPGPQLIFFSLHH